MFCYMAIHITYTDGISYKPKVVLHLCVFASFSTLMESTSVVSRSWPLVQKGLSYSSAHFSKTHYDFLNFIYIQPILNTIIKTVSVSASFTRT